MFDVKRFLSLLLASTALAQAASAPKVVRPSPELVIRLTGGEQLLLSKYRGKVVALEILLTTCPHCQRCSSVMNGMYATYGSRGFQPLGAAINEGSENLVPGFVHNLKLNFPVGSTSREMAYDYLKVSLNSGPVYMPTLVFIDRKGNIRAQYSGDNEFFKNEEKNMRDMIESLLAEDGTRPAPKKK